MGLGKLLGDFGRTNALDVGKSLVQGYKGVLETKEELRRNDLVEAMKLREEQRKETLFAQEQMEYQRKHKLRSFDEIARQSGLDPRIVKDYRDGFLSRGWLREDGMIEQQHLERWPEVTQMLEHKGDIHAKLMINGFTEKIRETQEKLEKTKNPEEIAQLQAEIKKYEGARSALAKQTAAIVMQAEQARAAQGVAMEDEREQAKLAKIKAEAEKERKQAAYYEALAKKTERGGGNLTVGVRNALTKGAVGIFFGNSMNSEVFKSGSKMEAGQAGEELKTTQEKMQWLQENDPNSFAMAQLVADKAKRILQEDKDGVLSADEALMQAMEEVESDYRQDKPARQQWIKENASDMSGYRQWSPSPSSEAPVVAPEATPQGRYYTPGGKLKEMGLGNWRIPDGLPDKVAAQIMQSVTNQIKKGATVETIRRALSRAGWKEVE